MEHENKSKMMEFNLNYTSFEIENYQDENDGNDENDNIKEMRKKKRTTETGN